MQYTSNYHLSKPEADDIINPNSRTGYNGNFDTIDTNLKSVSNKANANESDITDIQGDIADINAKTGDDIPFESGSADSISDKITNLSNLLNGVETRTLLWTNANPTAEFDTQTVSLDLTDYDFIEVYYTADNSNNYEDRTKSFTRAEVPSARNIMFGLRTADRYMGLRCFTVTTSGVSFEIAYISNSTTAWVNYNTWLVPVKIYGIKKVVA